MDGFRVRRQRGEQLQYQLDVPDPTAVDGAVPGSYGGAHFLPVPGDNLSPGPIATAFHEPRVQPCYQQQLGGVAVALHMDLQLCGGRNQLCNRDEHERDRVLVWRCRDGQQQQAPPFGRAMSGMENRDQGPNHRCQQLYRLWASEGEGLARALRLPGERARQQLHRRWAAEEKDKVLLSPHAFKFFFKKKHDLFISHSETIKRSMMIMTNVYDDVFRSAYKGSELERANLERVKHQSKETYVKNQLEYDALRDK